MMSRKKSALLKQAIAVEQMRLSRKLNACEIWNIRLWMKRTNNIEQALQVAKTMILNGPSPDFAMLSKELADELGIEYEDEPS